MTLWDSSGCRDADDKKDQANHQEQKEEKFGNSGRSSSYAGKSKQRRHQCDDQKDYSPTQHVFTSYRMNRARHLRRVFIAFKSTTPNKIVMSANY